MEVVNTTVADLVVDLSTSSDSVAVKVLVAVAKITFQVDPQGAVAVVEENPMPVLRRDVHTAFGIIPSDMSGVGGAGIEILVNGAACAPRGRPVTELEAILQIGREEHRILVFGDRTWIGRGSDAVPSKPAAFVRMPLTPSRAFGGSVDVWLDEHTVVPVAHPTNPEGLGFDPEPAIRALADQLGTPTGFPRCESRRLLPNLEHPSARVRSWSDAPRPYYWSGGPEQGPSTHRAAKPDAATAARQQAPPRVRHHGCLVHPTTLDDNSVVALKGMTPNGHITFPFPSILPFADIEVNGAYETRPLEMKRLVLLPEERRFTGTYCAAFRFAATDGGYRSLRLRLAATRGAK